MEIRENSRAFVSLSSERKLEWFEKLYDAYVDSLFAYFARRLSDRERAKELTQDVFMKTWEYATKGKAIEHERAFLFRLAHNLFVNEIRAKKHVFSLDASGIELADERESTALLAERRELMENLSSLKESYRTALAMRYLDGLPVRDIALVLEENETNISMRLSRALDALRDIYRYKQSQTS